MKKYLSLLLAAVLCLSLAACGSESSGNDGQTDQDGEAVELIVFAAASMQETLEEIADLYKEVAPQVTLVYNFDSSVTLLDNIEEGADCDLFISAAPTQMNALDGTLADDTEKNPDGQDLLLAGTRVDLLENKVALAVPEGNPKGIESFDQLAELLQSGDVFLAMGNSDVPVGQYTQKIFAYYGLDEAQLNEAGVLTYGTNVKEVTSQVSEAAVDCGVIYATDAFSAGLTVVDGATAEMCGQVIYPAAVLKNSQHPEEAKAFLQYLQTEEAGAVFESVGFTPLTGSPDSRELSADLTGQSLLIYCGAGMQEPFQVIAQTFQDLTGCEMNVTYANAAQIQTQIQQAQEGAYFIAGSADEVKPVSDYVADSVDLVKHIPVLAVAEGNPKNITGIADLANADIVTVTGDAESTPIGKIAVKAFSDFGVTDQVNLAATTTAPQLATLIALGEADAAIIWKENCNVDGVEICESGDMDAYVKTIPAARLSFSDGDQAADVFGDFLATDTAREIWTSFGYELVG